MGSLGMSVQHQIDAYIADQSPDKREDLQALHRTIRRMSPDCELWFLDGRNEDGKIVSNPNIGYGSQTTKYANGKAREFYKIGLSANTTGISVYLIGIEDKMYLRQTYGDKFGKASITGYCVKFKNLRDIDIGVLQEMIADHMGAGTARGS
jgi:hypothetical protein